MAVTKCNRNILYFIIRFHPEPVLGRHLLWFTPAQGGKRSGQPYYAINNLPGLLPLYPDSCTGLIHFPDLIIEQGRIAHPDEIGDQEVGSFFMDYIEPFKGEQDEYKQYQDDK